MKRKVIRADEINGEIPGENDDTDTPSPTRTVQEPEPEKGLKKEDPDSDEVQYDVEPRTVDERT